MQENLPKRKVLEIYRITLLSNGMTAIKAADNVLEIYRITLLSNQKRRGVVTMHSFGDLQNYTTLKLNYDNSVD